MTRLLQSPGFEELHVWNHRHDFHDDHPVIIFEGPALPAFCEALRNGKSLKALELHDVNLWADVAAVSQLIAALEGLPALQELGLWMNRTDDAPDTQRAAGECLASLIARSTCLCVLNVQDHRLSEAGLAPIFQALRGRTGLEELRSNGGSISAQFARDVVRPAVREHQPALRKLEGLSTQAFTAVEPHLSLHEVKDIMEARGLADKTAA